MSDASLSEFLRYLTQENFSPGDRLPPMQNLAFELGISVGKLREQLEVARQMGLVEVRPKTGIRFLGYSFYPTLRISLRMALAFDATLFQQFGILRNHIEASFWHEAVPLLTPEDKQHLQSLITKAWKKMQGEPVRIPHREHRDLHLAIYRHLENPFVRGLLKAYWDAYEAIGLNLYADYAYLQEVWSYHQKMVDAILTEDYDAGYQALVEHTGLLDNRPEMDLSRHLSLVSPGS